MQNPIEAPRPSRLNASVTVSGTKTPQNGSSSGTRRGYHLSVSLYARQHAVLQERVNELDKGASEIVRDLLDADAEYGILARFYRRRVRKQTSRIKKQ